MQNKNHLYAFVLGKNSTLSVAELVSFLKKELFIFVVLSISREVLIIKIEKEIKEPQWFINHLGGTIKIIGAIDEIKREKIKETIISHIENKEMGSKYIFGISSYSGNNKKTNTMGFEIKKELKKKNISSRFIRSKSATLTTAEIENNKILKKGSEFNIIENQDHILLGKTIAIQDFKSYSFRDYERPRRNPKSGMLPPKLSQIMINLLPNNPGVVYDPFCGNGTVLSEALLMGYEIMGSDISEKAVNDTKKNLEWINTMFDLNITKPSDKIFKIDAKIHKKTEIKVDSIVSELYLGPPLKNTPRKKEIREIERELVKLYIGFLKNTYKNLKEIKQLVVAIPFYKLKNTTYKLNIIDDIKKIGYNIQSPLKKHNAYNIFRDLDKKRGSILYRRENQIVGREIIILERQ